MELNLPEEILDDLREAARERGCSPHQFALETVWSACASLRLSKVPEGTHGAFTSGWKAKVEMDAEPEPYPVHLPEEMESV